MRTLEWAGEYETSIKFEDDDVSYQLFMDDDGNEFMFQLINDRYVQVDAELKWFDDAYDMHFEITFTRLVDAAFEEED
jgi:hypothetical protein